MLRRLERVHTCSRVRFQGSHDCFHTASQLVDSPIMLLAVHSLPGGIYPANAGLVMVVTKTLTLR
jgi:hypothetical protein